jgi:hypothetical protein
MDTFPIAPAASRWVWVLPILMAVLLGGVSLIVCRSVVASRTARFEVAPDGLHLRGDWYGRTIRVEQILRDGIRRIDFGAEPGLAPRWRTMGTGMPGYQSGWFRLRNGEKALLYLTDRSRAVYVPTTDGYSVMVSPADPDAFVGALRRLARD